MDGQTDGPTPKPWTDSRQQSGRTDAKSLIQMEETDLKPSGRNCGITLAESTEKEEERVAEDQKGHGMKNTRRRRLRSKRRSRTRRKSSSRMRSETRRWMMSKTRSWMRSETRSWMRSETRSWMSKRSKMRIGE